MNDMPQSEPAGQEQMASVQQARRLGPPYHERVARTPRDMQAAAVSGALVRHLVHHIVNIWAFAIWLGLGFGDSSAISGYDLMRVIVRAKARAQTSRLPWPREEPHA